MTTKVPSIPSPTSANLLNVAQAVKNLIDVREGIAGDPLDANVTFRDLVDAGAVVVRPRWTSGSGLPPVAPPSVDGDGYDGTTDLTPPPKPEGFTATGLFASIQLQWNQAQYRNHAYVEVWRSSTNALGNAILIGTSDTSFYVDQLGTSATRYYWIRFVSQPNIKGPYNATDGLSASTATDPALVLASLSGQITESQLYSSLASRINLIDAPGSVPGSVNARISVIQSQVDELSNTPPYDSAKSYSTNDLVTYNGGIYRAKQTTTGNLPTDATYWEKIGDYASLGQAVAAHTTQIGALTTDLSAEVTARQALSAQVNNPTTGLPATRAVLLTDYYTRSATDSAIASSSNLLTTQFNNQLAGYTNTATLVANYYTKSATDAAIAQSSNSLTTQFSNTLTGYVTSANLTANYYTKSATDSAISSATSNLVSTTALNTALSGYTNTATLQTNYYTKTQTDSAISSATTTLQSSVNNQLTGYATTASLQTEATTRSNADTSLFAQYTVKTDLAGRVAGFGLASETNTAGVNTSSFAVIADRFSISAPNDYTQEATPTSGVVAGKVWFKPSTKQTFRYDGASWVAFNPITPFAVQATPTTINGVSVPAGVYMDAAFIRDGTITAAKIGNAQIDNAKIANLDAAKITTGFLSADLIQVGTLDTKIANIDAAVIKSGIIADARIGSLDAGKITTGQLTADRIDGRNLAIKDASGNIILGAGTTLNGNYITVGAVSSPFTSAGNSGYVTIPSTQAGGYVYVPLTTTYKWYGGNIIMQVFWTSTFNINSSSTASRAEVTVQVEVNGYLYKSWHASQPIAVDTGNSRKFLYWDSSFVVIDPNNFYGLFNPVGQNNTIRFYFTGTAYLNNVSVAVGSGAYVFISGGCNITEVKV